MDLILLRVFQRELLLQCEFFPIAAQALSKSNRQGNLPWFAIEAMLNAAANISKILWGQGGRKSEERKSLRESIGITDESPLKSTAMRNHFAHFDERITVWWNESEDNNFIDRNFGDIHRGAIVGFPEHSFLRNFSPETGEVIFYGTTFSLKDCTRFH